MRISKINNFLSTLNFVLLFIGYQFATVVFLPINSDVEGLSRLVTIPYRGLALLISTLVIIINFKRRIIHKTLGIFILIFFWVILIIRMFYDIYLSDDVFITSTFQLWMYVFGICLPALYSVYKSIDKINFGKALTWTLSLTILTILLTLFANQNMLASSTEFSGRQSGNIALNTISYGHLGTMGLLLSIYVFIKWNLTTIRKVLLIIFILIAALTMLRAGSRSPIIAFLGVLLFWLFSKGKNFISGTFILIMVVAFLLIFLDQTLSLIGNVSPLIELRLRASIYEGDTSDRLPIYKQAWQTFIENPFLGDNFSLKGFHGEIHYSHNIILDSIMGLGLVGGISMIYILGSALIKSYKLIKVNDPNSWVTLILLQHIILAMFSGAFYYNPILSALLAFTFTYKSIIKNNSDLRIIKNEN